LLELTYEQWSEQIARLCETEPRLSLSQAWREFLDTLDLTSEATDTTLRQASQLYTDFLHRCKEPQYGLSLLQPGRFTMPGEDLKKDVMNLTKNMSSKNFIRSILPILTVKLCWLMC